MEFLAQIHSKLVHFPLAFLMLYPIIELLFLITKKDFYNKVAFLFLTIGVIGSFFAVLSGNQAFELVSKWQGDSKAIFNSHQTFANITVWSFTAILILRYALYIKKKFTKVIMILFLLLSIIGSYIVYQTGFYGGKLSKVTVLSSTIDSEN
jgi:uncharacterized membrane protein